MHGNRPFQYPFCGSVPQYHDWGEFMFNRFTLALSLGRASPISRKFIASAAAAVALLSAAVAPARAEPVKNIVLVHGAFADGSGWRRVAEILGKDGYSVSVVQEPLTSLADDVAATKRVLDLQQGPSILVGHSYGGVVITEAGNAPNVVGLVYIAAFIPDQGESAVGLLSKFAAANNDMRATKDDFLYLDPAAFPADFAADVPPVQANFMAHSQGMLAKAAAGAPVTAAAWHQKKSWALVATRDHNINPDLERSMAKHAGSETIEVPASHAVYISKPNEVARLIERAAKASAR
jgi:pimeloyl-ACP methyl ester carboxylesterase